MRGTMQVFSNPRQVVALPSGHRFPMSQYALLHARVLAECPGLQVAESPPASEGELALAHTPGYIAAVLNGTLPAAAQREIGLPWSPAMVQRSLHSVGATVATVCPRNWPAAPTMRRPTRDRVFVSSMMWRWRRA